MHTIFWLEKLKESEHLEGLGVEGRIILDCILEKYVLKLWTGFIWLRIITNDQLL
jgi:hypothetical protein